MKKFWIVLAAIAMLSLLCTLTVLAETNDGGVPAACEHSWKTFYDNDAHWEYCSECNAVQNRTEHSFRTIADGSQHAQVCDCGRVKSVEDHNWICVDTEQHKFVCLGCTVETFDCVYNEVAYFNSTYHTYACSACGRYDPYGEKELHREDLNQMQYNETSHWYGCVCGYGHRDESAHNFGDWVTDATHHWKECADCDAIKDKAEHSSEAVTCQQSAVCECGVACEAEYTHTGTATAYSVKNAFYHTVAYSCCGEIVNAFARHTFEDGVCTDCGYICNHDVAINGETHTYADQGEQHTATCQNCGKETDENHDWVNKDGVCTLCKKECSHDWKNLNGVCATCGYECQHTDTTTAPNQDSDDHDETCDVCNEVLVDNAAHSWVVDESNENQKKCQACGAICTHGENGALLEYKNADVEGTWKHWQCCTRCGYETAKEECVEGDTPATCRSLAVCAICKKGFGEVADHNWNTDGECETEGCDETCSHNYGVKVGTGDEAEVDAKHQKECSICHNVTDELCTGGVATCLLKPKCEKCQKTYGRPNLEIHDETCTVYVKDISLCTPAQHTAYYTCTKDTPIVENHDWSNKDGVCKTPGCGYICISPDLQVINDDDDTNNQHQLKCNTCGHIVMVDCSGGQATCLKKAKCTDCGAEYGEYSSTHDENCVRTVAIIPNNATCHNVYYSCKKDGEDQPIPTQENHDIDPKVGVCECGWHVVKQEEEQGGE